MLLDIDHVLFPHVVRNIDQLNKLDKRQAPFFRRIMNVESGGKCTPNLDPLKQMAANSYAIHKEHFWELGGYDETYQGLYGYDGSLVKKLGKRNADRLDVGLHGFTYGGGGSSWTRDEKDRSQAIYRANGVKMGQNRDERRLKFTWKKSV